MGGGETGRKGRLKEKEIEGRKRVDSRGIDWRERIDEMAVGEGERCWRSVEERSEEGGEEGRQERVKNGREENSEAIGRDNGVEWEGLRQQDIP